METRETRAPRRQSPHTLWVDLSSLDGHLPAREAMLVAVSHFGATNREDNGSAHPW
jgi:hypothetical protein